MAIMANLSTDNNWHTYIDKLSLIFNQISFIQDAKSSNCDTYTHASQFNKHGLYAINEKVAMCRLCNVTVT